MYYKEKAKYFFTKWCERILELEILRKKEKVKEYRSRPEVKEKIKKYEKEYNQRPEVKEKRRIYYKEWRRRNNNGKN